MPPLDAYIDLHCERTQPGLFEEPLNTLSSMLFFVSAYFLFRLLQKQPNKPFSLKFMVCLTGLIGAGSMTFHMTARMWAATIADVLPIAIFAVTFLFLFVRHVLRLNIFGSIISMLIFAAVNIAFKITVMKAADGYVSVIPTIIMFLGISIYMFITKNPSFKAVAGASVISIFATYFRVIDSQICETFPYGTHFLWHSLMAGFFYINLREIILRYNYAPERVS